MTDVYFHGQACVRIKGKNAVVVFDPYDADFTGLSALKVSGDIVCVSHDHKDHNNVSAVSQTEDGKSPFVISGPGEYEISGVNIVGISSFHDDKGGVDRGKNTIYCATIDEMTFVHLGDLGQKKLTEGQIEELSACDVLFIPVGGVYTISGKEAADIVAEIGPKIVVPIHYKLPSLKFELEGVETFLSTIGKEGLEAVPKLSVSKERLPEEPEVVLLQKQ